MRGQSNPRETKGAQEIKAQFGGLRMQNPQRDIQRFVRDVLRLKAEIIAEHFSPETLAEMTGIDLPTAEQKQLAGQVVQMVKNPKTAAIAEGPTWDDVMALLRNDPIRGFRIDVETDSTSIVDAQAEKQSRGEFLQALTLMVKEWLPAVQQGLIPPQLFKSILLFALRPFKVGRELEDAIDTIDQVVGQQQPDPRAEAQKAELESKVEQKEKDRQLKTQIKQADLQLRDREIGVRENVAAVDAAAKIGGMVA